MRMLSLMCGKTKHDRIKNKNIRVRVANIVEKTVETRLCGLSFREKICRFCSKNSIYIS